MRRPVGSTPALAVHAVTVRWPRAIHGGMGVRTVVVALLSTASGFYLPGIAPHEYADGERVEIKVNQLSSTKTQMPYDYYSLPFCKPAETVSAARVGVDGVGPITGLPMPRFVSLKATKANVRRGPGMTHRVDWVFVRQGMPLEVIAEYGHWRRVRDPEGASGWLHYSMIRGNRTALVTAETTDLRLEPAPGAPVSARAERGVVFEIEACQRDWCEVEKDGVDGWAAKADLWGVGPEEIFD